MFNYILDMPHETLVLHLYYNTVLACVWALLALQIYALTQLITARRAQARLNERADPGVTYTHNGVSNYARCVHLGASLILLLNAASLTSRQFCY